MEVSSEVISLVRPEVAKYSDFRLFLGDFYKYKKAHRSGFSFRKFAELAGMKSPNYLQLVINGKRNLSLDSARAVTKALKLSKIESQYFLSLVQRSLAQNDEEREKAHLEYLETLGSLLKKQIAKDQDVVLEKWHHLVLREVLTYLGTKATYSDIVDHLRNFLSPEDVEESVELLLRAGFLEVKKGAYVQREPVIETGDGFGELRILRAHREILNLWSKHLHEFQQSERELGIINIPIDSAKIPEFKRRIQKFQNEIVGWLQEEKNPNSVVQLGTYLIPLTRKLNSIK